MKKHILLFLSLFTVVVLSIGISSCGDDPPPPNPKLSMLVAEKTVGEDDGTIEVKMVLDKAAPTDLIIEYEIDGSAVEGSSASSDYEIQGDAGVVEFQQGETSATIEIEIKNDNVFEGNETIELTIQDANTDKVEITADDVTKITIEDDDTQATATFSETEMTVSESDGLLEIEVKLDKAAGKDITVEYTLSGSAVDSLTAWDQEIAADYYIDGVSGEVEIAEGETVGVIKIQLYTDFVVEDAIAGGVLDPETIEITLTGANNGVAIGDDDKLNIHLKQQDGRIIALDWADPTTDSADMDLFYWVGEFGSSTDDLGTIPPFWSIRAAYFGPEIIFIPNNLPQLFLNGDTDASFGVSYTYWGGNRNSLSFEVTFVDIVNGVVEGSGTRDTFNATYTMANINEWDDATAGSNPAIVQTFNKVSGTYTAATQITVPGSGSRVRTGGGKLPPNVIRGKQKPIVLR
jgi:hypothetical protein